MTETLITKENRKKLVLALEKNNKFMAYMLGLDSDVDKSIIQYIKREELVTFSNLELYFVYKEDICGKTRLCKRIKQLLKIGLIKRSEYKKHTFYEIDYYEP